MSNEQPTETSSHAKNEKLNILNEANQKAYDKLWNENEDNKKEIEICKACWKEEMTDRMNKEKEIERLKDWKESAITHTPDLQAIGKVLNIRLGESVSDKVLPEIKKLIDQLQQKEARIKELEEGLKNLHAKAYDLLGGENAPDNGEIPEITKAKQLLTK